MQIKLFFLVILLVFAGACSTSKQGVSAISDLKEYAELLAGKTMIIDGHVDLPYRLKVHNFRLTREYIDIPIETDDGDFDYMRAREGGLDAPFMSIYIPASYQVDGGGLKLADSLIDMVNYIIDEHPDKFGRGRTPAELKSNFDSGIVSLPMGMENAAPIGTDLERIGYFYERGIRYMTLTHSRDNQICDSSYDTTRTWNGLSPFGYDVVPEMNRVGIMVDISHVSDSSFYQVMRLTDVPCIASHSSCRKFTPGFERNMSDDMIAQLGQNGGVMMINFGSTFLDDTVRTSYVETRSRMNSLLKDQGLTIEDRKGKRVVEKFKKDNEHLLWTDVRMVANHIDHAVSIAGIDHVGFGSDFDGVGDSLPTGLKDVSQYPNLIYELLRRGYTVDDIEKICYKNLIRVWSEVQEYAGQYE